MAWIILLLAGLSEVAMAYFLKLSDGFSQLWPSIGFLVAGALSFFLLAYTLKWLPVGTAYAVWTGIGAVGTAIVGMIFLGESRDVARLVSIVLIIAGVVGLQLSSSGGH